MAFTPYTGSTSIIGPLGTDPVERALTTQEFKDKFDQFAKEFVAWFNDTHKGEFDAKAEAASLTAHQADAVTDVDGVHGLKIESGVFTPVLKGTTTAGANTYAAQSGFYHKIGSLVHCDMIITLSSKDAAMAGSVYIDGLPFAFKNTANLVPSISIGEMENITFDSGITGLNGFGQPNTSTIIIMQFGSAKGYVRLPAANIAGNTAIMASVTYQV